MKRRGKTLLILLVVYLGVAIALIIYQKHREDVNNFGMSFNEERKKIGLTQIPDGWRSSSYEDYDDTLATNISWTSTYDINTESKDDSSDYQEFSSKNIKHIEGNRISETDTYFCRKDSLLYTLNVHYFFKPKTKGILWESTIDIANLNLQRRIFEQNHKEWESRQNTKNTDSKTPTSQAPEVEEMEVDSAVVTEEDYEPELDSVTDEEYTEYREFPSARAKASADSTLKAWKGIKKRK
jgi:hypothetical protein